MGCLFALILWTVFAVLSWLFVTGISALVCLCLGVAWSLKVATGVWLILFMLTVMCNGKK